jgi:hypothetical protein
MSPTNSPFNILACSRITSASLINSGSEDFDSRTIACKMRLRASSIRPTDYRDSASFRLARCPSLWGFDRRPRSWISWTPPEALFLFTLGGLLRVCRGTCTVLSSGLSDQRWVWGLLRLSVRFVGVECHGWQCLGSARCSS